MVAGNGLFCDQVIVVSGGATGIGAATVEAFCEAGGTVACIDRNAEEGLCLVDRIQKRGGSAEFFAADVGNRLDVEAAIAAAVERMGAPSVLVNHAGTAIVKPFLELKDNDFWHLMRVNLYSMFCMSQAVIPHMIGRGGGSIVCTSSISASLATPHEILYCTSKAACEMFARSIAVEFQRQNIRCNSVSPGFIDTPHGQRELRDLREGGVDVDIHAIEQRQGRLGVARDIADVIVFAASPHARFVNGANIVADNGFSAQ